MTTFGEAAVTFGDRTLGGIQHLETCLGVAENNFIKDKVFPMFICSRANF
jgi:hypothetical protein